MIYVYDVLVNLNEELYDFYDWEESDNLSHVRRVPIFKVVDSTYFDIVTKKVKINSEILSSIKDKTQLFSSRNIEIIPYSAIFTNGSSAIMVEFSEKGYSLRKSKFLINEEMEILDITNSMKVTIIQYNVINNRVKMNNMIRSEKKILESILSELEYFKDDSEKIDYLYYEWFEKQEGTDKYESLVKSLKRKFTNKHMEFLELLNLLTIKK